MVSRKDNGKRDVVMGDEYMLECITSVSRVRYGICLGNLQLFKQFHVEFSENCVTSGVVFQL